MEDQAASTSKLAPHVPAPNLINVNQFALEVRGWSANLAADDGEYALCADYQGARPTGLQGGDLVVFEKRRRDEYKVMIARLHFVDNAWELHYQSDHPRWMQRKPVRLSEDRKRDINDPSVQEIEIIAFALGFYREGCVKPIPSSQTERATPQN
jgi:hypothetical protein